jgi:hypothetical protein
MGIKLIKGDYSSHILLAYLPHVVTLRFFRNRKRLTNMCMQFQVHRTRRGHHDLG